MNITTNLVDSLIKTKRKTPEGRGGLQKGPRVQKDYESLNRKQCIYIKYKPGKRQSELTEQD